CPEPEDARRRHEALFHEATVARQSRGGAGEGRARERLECLQGSRAAPLRRGADQPRLSRGGRLEHADVWLVRQQRLDEDVHGAAAGEAEVAGEVRIEMMGEERGTPLRLRLESRANDLGLHAAAAHRSDQSAFGTNEHLGSRGHWRRAAHARHGRERARTGATNEVSGGLPDVHARKSKLPGPNLPQERLASTIKDYGVTTSVPLIPWAA